MPLAPMGRSLCAVFLLLVAGCQKPSVEGLLDRAKAALGDPMSISRCYASNSTTPPTQATDSAHPDTLGLPLLARTEAQWALGKGDTVEITLYLYVAGTARSMGGGYPSYTVILDSRVDTVRGSATVGPNGSWSVVCQNDLLPYSEIRDLADPGFYTNPDVFKEVLRRADSIRGSGAH